MKNIDLFLFEYIRFMQLLFKKVVYFIGLFLLLFISINVWIEHLAKSRINFTHFKYKQNPTYIIAGNSRPHNAFNDSIIDGAVNIAEVAESYYFIYLKFKNIFKYNKRLKVVFLEFDNNQISTKINQSIYGSNYLSQKLPVHLPFMTFEEKWQLFNWNRMGFIDAFIVSHKINILKVIKPKSNTIPDFGGYFPNPHSRLDSLLKYAPLSAEFNEFKINETKVSTLNMFFLRKCIDECRKNKIRVILIRSPLHAKSPILGNERTYKKILHSSFKDVEYIDFKNFIVPDSCYADLTHFNYRGADIFSTWFSLQLKNGLLKSKNIQLAVDSAILNNNNLY